MTDIKSIIRQTQGSHWYNRDGTPAYTVLNADGTKQVNTTIVHARKLGLLPSVTTVLKILSKESITTWKQEQMLKATINTPRLENEEENLWFRRIIEEADRPAKTAREFGDAIHKYCEMRLCGHNHLTAMEIPVPTAQAIDRFIEQHIREAIPEFTVLNTELGFAGRTDVKCKFDGELSIIDWKNQNTKDIKPKYYDEWVYQGGAYTLGTGVKNFISVIISRDEQGKIEYYKWTDEELKRGQEIFKSILKTFRLINKLED